MPDDAYPYLEDITAGSLENEFNCGDDVPVKALLYHMIRYSDNTASHILFDHLGGWREYKDIASNYVDVLKDSDFLSRENIIKANYLSQYLRLIYEHQDMYTELLKDMLAAEPENYLNLEESMHNKLYQKYGFYMSACNSAGLNLEDGNNYSIVVLTKLGERGEAVIGEISELVYNYYHPEKQKTKNAVTRSGKD